MRLRPITNSFYHRSPVFLVSRGNFFPPWCVSFRPISFPAFSLSNDTRSVVSATVSPELAVVIHVYGRYLSETHGEKHRQLLISRVICYPNSRSRKFSGPAPKKRESPNTAFGSGERLTVAALHTVNEI